MKPVLFIWEGDVMRPLGRFSLLCDRQFVVGENYRLEVVEERSAESHRHYFACVNEAWANLPEIYNGRWRTPDDLRRWALIQAGWKNETTFICASKAEAVRLAPFLEATAATRGDYAEVKVDGKLISFATAKSQSYQEMPSKKEFQKSKDDVLDVIAGLIGVTRDDLAANSGRAA